MAERIELMEGVSSYRWVVMGSWLTCSVCSFMIVATIGILLPAISSDLHLAPGQQGLLSSAALWGNLTLAIPLGWWVSKYSPKLLTTVTLVLGSCCLFLQGWAPVFAVLLVGRLGFGITQIARQPARVLLTQQWFPRREFIQVNSLANALFGLVVGVGFVAAPFMLSRLGGDWRAAFYIFGGFFSVLTLLWMLLGRDHITPDYARRELSQNINLLKGALAYRDLWVAGFGMAGSNLAESAFLSFFPTAMLNTYDLSLQWSGAVLALGILVGGISGIWLGPIGVTLNKRKGILKIVGIVITGTLIGMLLTGSIPVLLILSLVNGIAWGFWPILFTVPFHLPAVRLREIAVAVSFMFMMIAAGQALGPIVAGYLQEGLGDLRMALFIVSFATLSLIVTGVLLRPGARVQGSTQEANT